MDSVRPAVALTLREDQIVRDTDPWSLNPTTFRDVAKWLHRNGNKDRIRNIKYGLDHCDGWFHLTLIEASVPTTEPRKIIARSYLADRRGHIALNDFAPLTGGFQMQIHKV